MILLPHRDHIFQYHYLAYAFPSQALAIHLRAQWEDGVFTSIPAYQPSSTNDEFRPRRGLRRDFPLPRAVESLMRSSVLEAKLPSVPCISKFATWQYPPLAASERLMAFHKHDNQMQGSLSCIGSITHSSRYVPTIGFSQVNKSQNHWNHPPPPSPPPPPAPDGPVSPHGSELPSPHTSPCWSWVSGDGEY